MKTLAEIKTIIGLALVSALVFSAGLFGAISQIVPPNLARASDRVFNCDFVMYKVRYVQTPGWACVERSGLSLTFVLSCLLALCLIVAIMVGFSLPKSKVGRTREAVGMFLTGVILWIVLASGFTWLFRAVNVVLGRLYFEALLMPSICLLGSIFVIYYLRTYVSIFNRY